MTTRSKMPPVALFPARPSCLATALIVLPLVGGCTASQPADPRPSDTAPAPVAAAAGRAGIGTDPTPDVLAVLTAIREADTGQLAVSEEDGRFLRTLVLATGARRVLEIGGASGYSAIWMGLGLRETGGSLVTIEYDAERAAALKANIAAAHLDDIVTVIAGDALQELPGLDGPFDVVFIDAWKPDYTRYYELTLPKLRQGGLLLAHNVINKGDEMQDFLKTVQERPDVLTAIVAPSGEGVSVSLKR